MPVPTGMDTLNSNAPDSDARRPYYLILQKKKETANGPSVTRTQEQRYEATPLGASASASGFIAADVSYTSLQTNTFNLLHRLPFASNSANEE